MTIQIATTAYGRPSIDLLAAQLDTLKDDEALAPVTVVVRSNHVSVSTRRALAARPGGIVNVTFITLRRLAEQLGAATLGESGRRPLTAPLMTSAIRATLAETPGSFAPVAAHPATEQALARAYRELRTAPDDSLDAMAATSTTTSDVVRIVRLVRERLSQDWYDEEDLLSTAAQILALDGGTAPPTVAHLLPAPTTGEFAVMRVLADRARVFVNVGLTGDANCDAVTVTAYCRAGITVPTDEAVEPPLASGIVSASDPDDEVRVAVRTVTGWMRDGVSLGRIALFYPSSDPYARLLHEQLGAAGIPVNGAPLRPIGEMLYGRTIRRLLALSDRAFRRQDVLGLLADAPMLDGSGYAPTQSWERISRAAGIVRGQDWLDRLPRWADAQRRDAEKLEQNGEESRAENRRREAERADALGGFVAGLRSDLEPGTELRSWTELVAWLKLVVGRYLGGEQRRKTWPDDEWQAARRVEEILDRLAGLDALSAPPPTMDVFRRTLDSELEGALRTGRSGDGVLIGHISVAAGMVFERMVMLGMSEGRFPPRRLEDSLLPDIARAAGDGNLQLRTDRQLDDRRNLLAAIAGADQAVLSQPRGDLRRSTDQPASRWLLADAARLARVDRIDSSALRDRAAEPWLDHIPSFAGGLAHSSAHPSSQELRLAAIARRSLTHPVLTDDRDVRAALEVVRARRSNAFTRFDGNLSGLGADLALPTRISTTGLEVWAKCPRTYLFRHVLKVEPREEPERLFEIDPRTRGTLVHTILEKFVHSAIKEEHPFGCWTPSDRDRLQQIAAAQFDEAEREGRSGHAILWRAERTRIAAELDRLLTMDSQRLADGMRPRAAELPFDDVEIALPSGHVLHMRGFVDRIDADADGSLEVIDYKTGSAGTYRELSEDDPHRGGRYLQLYVYARAALKHFPDAPSVRAYYWFTKDAKRHGYPITERVEQRVLDAMDRIITGIGAGAFPARPSDKPTWGWVDCWFCTPDGLSDQHTRREWERKRADPTLADYLALINPNVDNELD